MKKQVLTYDKCFQVNLTAVATHHEVKSKFTSIKPKNSELPVTTRLRKKNSRTNLTMKRKQSILSSSRTGIATPTHPQVTEAVPFTFQNVVKKTERKIQTSILPKYIIAFKKQYGGFKNPLSSAEDNEKIIKSYRTIPLKLFLKSISSLYSEKAVNAKNSKAVRIQSLAEYLYDNTYNKYGIAKLTEKKLTEICATTMLNYKKFPEIELFSYFIGLTGKFYTNDDLTFYYKIEKIYANVQIDGEQTIAERVYEVYFETLVGEHQLHELMYQISSVLKSKQNYQQKVTNKYWTLNFLIQQYRELKKNISLQYADLFVNEELDSAENRSSSFMHDTLKNQKSVDKVIERDLAFAFMTPYDKIWINLLVQSKQFSSFKKIIRHLCPIDASQPPQTTAIADEEIEYEFDKFKVKRDAEAEFSISNEQVVSIIINKGLWRKEVQIEDNESITE